jgi:cold-inducible RNA-binding protein
MSESKIYVGNLSYQTSEDQLRDFFAQYGSIEDLKLIIDFQTGRSKGFAFITFASDEDAKKALEANGTDLDGRSIVVNAARENKGGSGGDRRGGGGGDRRGGGAGGNGGGGRRW